MKIEGIPDGFEVRCVYDAQRLADAVVSGQKLEEGERVVCAIIRKVEHVCTWPHGVFKDGWLAQDDDGYIYWHEERPNWDSNDGWWSSGGDTHGIECVIQSPVFKEDVSYSRRIVQVGPIVEPKQ